MLKNLKKNKKIKKPLLILKNKGNFFKFYRLSLLKSIILTNFFNKLTYK
jgi:hypothetical protein